MISRELINCVIVGMRDMPVTALLRQLRDETKSPLAMVARAAADEMSKVLGPLPKFDVQFLRKLRVPNYEAVMDHMLPGRKNLICVGLTEKTYDAACAFIKRLRHAGENSLAVAIYDGNLSPDTGLIRHRLAKLNHMGFDRVVSNSENPAAIKAIMQSLVRNDTMRMEKSVLESIGPLRIVWDSDRQRSTRQIEKIYVEDNVGEKVAIHLTGKELSILERLAHTPGSVVSKKDLINYLYTGRDEAEEKIIDVFICKMRRKIAKALQRLGYANIENEDGPIDTTWGKGYLLNPHFGQNIAKVAVRPEHDETPEPRAESFAP